LFTNLFTTLNEHKKVLATIASIFLILVGIYYLFFKKVKVNAEGMQTLTFNTGDYLKIFTMGLIMNVFNPGIIIFWLTTSTTFIGNTLQHRIVIFSTALFLALAADVLKVLLANNLRKRLTPKNIHRTSYTVRLFLIVFHGLLNAFPVKPAVIRKDLVFG